MQVCVGVVLEVVRGKHRFRWICPRGVTDGNFGRGCRRKFGTVDHCVSVTTCQPLKTADSPNRAFLFVELEAKPVKIQWLRRHELDASCDE